MVNVGLGQSNNPAKEARENLARCLRMRKSKHIKRDAETSRFKGKGSKGDFRTHQIAITAAIYCSLPQSIHQSIQIHFFKIDFLRQTKAGDAETTTT